MWGSLFSSKFIKFYEGIRWLCLDTELWFLHRTDLKAFSLGIRLFSSLVFMNMYKPCLYFSRNGILFLFFVLFLFSGEWGGGGQFITIGNLISPGRKVSDPHIPSWIRSRDEYFHTTFSILLSHWIKVHV